MWTKWFPNYLTPLPTPPPSLTISPSGCWFFKYTNSRQVSFKRRGLFGKPSPFLWKFFSFTNQDNWTFRKSKKQLEKWFLFWAWYKKQNHDFLFFSFTPARQISRKMKHLTLLEKLSSKSDLIWCYVSQLTRFQTGQPKTTQQIDWASSLLQGLWWQTDKW